MNSAEDVLLPSSAVRARYGDRSQMWLWRRLHDDPKFPRPRYIKKRRYWSQNELIAWERDLSAA